MVYRMCTNVFPLLVLVTIYASAMAVPRSKTRRTCVIFDEDFSQDLQGNKKWSHEVSLWGGGNNEFQAYLPDAENAYTHDGILHIKPTLLEQKNNTGRNITGDFQDWLNTGSYDLNSIYGACTREPCRRSNGEIPPIASARLHTKDTFTFKYGRVDIRAKMPKGDWLWPALWLLPPDTSNYPYSGEMDMVEARGNLNLHDPETGASRGVDCMTCALHVCSRYKKPHYDYRIMPNGTNWADKFYNFTLDWQPDSVRFYADGVEVLKHVYGEDGSFNEMCYDTQRDWNVSRQLPPFDKEFYLIINLAVGGMTGYWHPALQPTNPWAGAITRTEALKMFYAAKDQWLPTWVDTLQVESVKVTQQKGWTYTLNGVRQTACKRIRGLTVMERMIWANTCKI